MFGRPTNLSQGSTVQRVNVNPDREDRYKSLLPKEIVDWINFEAPQPFTYESVYPLWQKFGPKTLEMLQGASAVDCQNVMKEHGLKGVHPNSFEAKYGNPPQQNG